ncbi:MAG: hypothetical protein WC356_02775 [Candidatus Micrarchaeia archaeon]|jgi:hypothetical protein
MSKKSNEVKLEEFEQRVSKIERQIRCVHNFRRITVDPTYESYECSECNIIMTIRTQKLVDIGDNFKKRYDIK